MESQKIIIKNEIYLDDVNLDKNKEIDIYSKNKKGEPKLLRIANVDGQIFIFTTETINIENWQGAKHYQKRINEIYDNELD